MKVEKLQINSFYLISFRLILEDTIVLSAIARFLEVEAIISSL